jgi:hypothetical protein
MGVLAHEGVDLAFLVTTGTFSSEALAWSSDKPLILIDAEEIDRLLSITAVEISSESSISTPLDWLVVLQELRTIRSQKLITEEQYWESRKNIIDSKLRITPSERSFDHALSELRALRAAKSQDLVNDEEFQLIRQIMVQKLISAMSFGSESNKLAEVKRLYSEKLLSRREFEKAIQLVEQL